MRMKVDFVSSFATHYQRNNKNTKQKNLRCFPSCSPKGHRPTGFCGGPIICKVHGVDGLPKGVQIYCWGEIVQQRNKQNDLPEFGSEHLLTQFTLLERDNDNPLNSLLRGNVLSLTCTDGDVGSVNVAFNEKLAGWHYGWRASKHTCEEKHCFKVLVFAKQKLKSERLHENQHSSETLVFVGVGYSPSFQIYSRRKAKKRLDDVKVPASVVNIEAFNLNLQLLDSYPSLNENPVPASDNNKLKKLAELSLAVKAIPSDLYAKVDRETIILYRFLNYFLHHVKEESVKQQQRSIPKEDVQTLLDSSEIGDFDLEENFNTSGHLDEAMFDMLTCLLPSPEELGDLLDFDDYKEFELPSPASRQPTGLTPKQKQDFALLNELVCGLLSYAIQGNGFSDQFTHVAKHWSKKFNIEDMKVILEQQELLMFHHVDTNLFLVKYITTLSEAQHEKSTRSFLNDEFFTDFSPGLTEMTAVALKFVREFLLMKKVSIDGLYDILELSAKQRLVQVDLGTPPSIFTALLIHYQIFNSKDNFNPELVAAGKDYFETEFQRNYWNRSLFVFSNIMFGRIISLRVCQELSHDLTPSPKYASRSAVTLEKGFNINGCWVRVTDESEDKQLKSLMKLIDAVWGLNVSSLLQTLHRRIFKKFKFTCLDNTLIFEGERVLFLQMKGSLVLDGSVQLNVFALGMFNPMFSKKRYVGWVEHHATNGTVMKLVIAADLISFSKEKKPKLTDATGDHTTSVSGQYGRFFLEMKLESSERLIVTGSVFFFSSEKESIKSMNNESTISAPVSKRARQALADVPLDKCLDAPSLDDRTQLREFFGNLDVLKRRREHYVSVRDIYQKTTD